jgi:hypothetical protein
MFYALSKHAKKMTKEIPRFLVGKKFPHVRAKKKIGHYEILYRASRIDL